MFVHIIFSSVWVAEWPPFGKELLTRLTISYLCILTICNFSYIRFGFDGSIWVLIAPVPGQCILVTFITLFLSVRRFFFYFLVYGSSDPNFCTLEKKYIYF